MSQAKPSSASQSNSVEATLTKEPVIVRDGTYMVVPQRWIDLPPNCVICGAAEIGRLRLRIRKASRVCAIFGYIGAIFYFSAPGARLRAGLCKAHRSQERGAQIVVRGLLWSSLACILVAFFLPTAEGLLLGVAGPITLVNLVLIYEIARRKLLTIAHADRRYVWLAGVSPAFLGQLREIPRQPDAAASHIESNN
jgi:hypothetical protein